MFDQITGHHHPVKGMNKINHCILSPFGFTDKSVNIQATARDKDFIPWFYAWDLESHRLPAWLLNPGDSQ